MNIKQYAEQASLLKREADQLLADLALIDIFARFGVVHLTGSYKYDLMTRRDIDVCVEMANPSEEMLFDMGVAIAALPHVGSMYFRNEYVLRTPGNPLAMFWVVDVYRPGGDKWTVDILVSTPAEVKRVIDAGAEQLHGLDPEKRACILEIKGHLTATKDYRKTYKSTDIYEAVMKGGVKDLAGWNAWWKHVAIKSPGTRNTP
nr:hypothetical protein [Candidatus Sigynarchaeota archaeon]